MKKKNICLAANNNYFNQLSVTIISLLKNSSSPRKIKLNVIDGGINEPNKKKLKKIIENLNSAVTFIKIDAKKYQNLKICGHPGEQSYYRLEIPTLFPKEKVLYLDSDLVILDNVLNIFDENLGKKTVGAVKDYFIGLVEKKNYFNAGVMLIDCKRWNKKNYSKYFFEWAKKNEKQIHFADQDILNGILAKDWKSLPLKWNRQRILLDYPRKKLNLSKEEYSFLKNKPSIIHYTGKIKPWHYRYVFPDKKQYLHYLEKFGLSKDYSDKGIENFFYKKIRYLVYRLKLRYYLEKNKLIPRKWR